MNRYQARKIVRLVQPHMDKLVEKYHNVIKWKGALLGNTSKNGMVGETAVLNRLVQLGYEVLLPWSKDSSYDLAYYVEMEEQHFGFFVHRESQLVRVQCKVAWLSKDGGSLKFNTSTVSMGGAGVWKKK